MVSNEINIAIHEGEDRWQKMKRKGKTELDGGAGVGYWVWCFGCFAARG